MNATAYPQQGWSAPQQGQPAFPPRPAFAQPPAWSAPTHPGPKTNLMALLAIGAAAAGTTVLLGLGSIAAIVLGCIALAQIKRTGDDGKLLAIWGIVLGGVTLVALLAMIVLGVSAFASFVQSLPGF
ncbi:DUF4190 domain-containing protein [Agrococcus sp. Marseille-P2731]|uniref:DUF4190 domain-containing protein n=1 Tax=Agrococcus sp. Marseille-P2731 TaxID=1841862 RepID=UPI000930FC4E|nr:DUF4190 domain-containing protein [Agrococcus sp. Marseille-P2731]